jgi:20S proteasome subunit beta 4
LKSTHDKTVNLSEHLVMAVNGQGGDSASFSEYIQRNVSLYSIRNDYPLTTSAAAHYIRSEIAGSLRTRVRTKDGIKLETVPGEFASRWMG